jgi:hypothetical protein
MSIRWLTVQSFQQSQDLLAAVNALSIHLKSELARIPDEERAAAAEQARELLSSFFDQFEVILNKVEHEDEEPVLGADPRLRQLARNFIEARRNRRRFHSELFACSSAHIKHLLHSKGDGDKRALVQCLADLRVLLEEHLQVDAERMLGDI